MNRLFILKGAIGTKRTEAEKLFRPRAEEGYAQRGQCLLRTTRLDQGQSVLEYAVLVGAVTFAIILMSEYVRNAFNAHANAIEDELSGATEENKP